jgi:hypothetical protein
MELATPAARQRKELLTLGWAFAAEKQPHELMGVAGKATAQKIADFVVAGGFSALLAPTHYLRSSDDEWIAVDCWITQVLRDCLDVMGASQVPIYYPLALSAVAFRNPVHRKEIVRLLKDVPIDSVWLRVLHLARRPAVRSRSGATSKLARSFTR